MKKLTKVVPNLEQYVLQETRTIYFHEEVSSFSVERIMQKLEFLTAISTKPITLRLCSPGGSVDHGLVLYDYMKSSKTPIHTLVSGMAASMAAILLGAGRKGKRVATKNSRIMIHQPSSGYMGKAADIEIHAKEIGRLRTLLNTVLSNDTGQPLSKVSKDTSLDYWMTAEEAKIYGLVDKVI